MAGPPIQEPGISPAPTALPPSPYTASPITPTSTRPRLNPRRQSRFTEDVMSARTPAASVSERSFDHWYGPSTENINASVTHNETDEHNHNSNINNITYGAKPPPGHATRSELSGGDQHTWLRFVNGSLHALPCLVLLGIMGYAIRVLRQDLRSHMSIQAIFLILFLFMDVTLDLVVLLRVHKPWPTWGLGFRFACGITYVVHFLLYVGLGGAFPEGYTYWGLRADFAGPLVYILLCVSGIWNLLHIPVCRYHVGSRIFSKHNSSSPSTNRENRASFNQRVSTVGTERSSISLTWRGWVRTQSSAQYSRDDLENLRASGLRGPSSIETTLRERHGEGEKDGGMKGGDKWQEGGLEAGGKEARVPAG